MTFLETKMDHLVSKMVYLETKMVSLFATIIPLLLILVLSTATLGVHAIPTEEIQAAHIGLADVLQEGRGLRIPRDLLHVGNAPRR